MVTIIGSVPSRNDDTPGPSEPRRFAVETSIYDTSKATPVPFSVACFLENTKRWQRVKIPPAGAFLCVTAKVVGRTTDTNHLALRVLDLAYLPRPASAVVTPASTSSTPSKRSVRWDGRATPSTPSKRSRLSEPANGVANPSDENPAPQSTTGRGLDLSHIGDITESPPSPPSPSTAADPAESSLTSVSSPNFDGDSRPHRNRHPPKRLQS
jgi:hypothetical protein